MDYAKQYGPARAEIVQWLTEGKLQRKETIIKGGLKVAEQALVDLYKGVNTGQLFPISPSMIRIMILIWYSR